MAEDIDEFLGLPAHRYERSSPEFLESLRDVSYRKKDKKGKVITFDFDETITKAPKRMAHLAKALKKAGDEIVVVTGNSSSAEELEQRLNDYGVPFDRLIQYEDDESDGVQRKDILKELGAWLAFDDRAGRAPVLTKACPHLFLSAKPTKDNLKAADDAESAKKIVKDL